MWRELHPSWSFYTECANLNCNGIHHIDFRAVTISYYRPQFVTKVHSKWTEISQPKNLVPHLWISSTGVFYRTANYESQSFQMQFQRLTQKAITPIWGRTLHLLGSWKLNKNESNGGKNWIQIYQLGLGEMRVMNHWSTLFKHVSFIKNNGLTTIKKLRILNKEHNVRTKLLLL